MFSEKADKDDDWTHTRGEACHAPCHANVDVDDVGPDPYASTFSAADTLTPTLSGSKCTAVTLPSSVTMAQRLPLF